MNITNDYWFTIEPYIYISIANKCALLYNTLDGKSIESDKTEVIALLQEMLQEENCGVTLLKSDQYTQKNTRDFIGKLRKKYMGDIIDVTLSKGKPIQVLPYFNYPTKRDKKCDFLVIENLLQTLFEISIHIDHTIDIVKLMAILQSMPDNLNYNINGAWDEITNMHKLFSFLNQRPASKTVVCSYIHVTALDPDFNNDFSYKISVCFPIDKILWDKSIRLLQNQDLPFEYVFDVTSLDNCQEAEQLVVEYQIEKYHLNPVYIGDNVEFFKENVFLTQEDILSTPVSIKDIFSKQSMNMHDFGKFNIMSNGDVYANVKHSILGNIYTHSMYELIRKEIKDGKSWLRTRNQSPCSDCIYQYLCPSPSDYEIAIGTPNLCHVQ